MCVWMCVWMCVRASDTRYIGGKRANVTMCMCIYIDGHQRNGGRRETAFPAWNKTRTHARTHSHFHAPTHTTTHNYTPPHMCHMFSLAEHTFHTCTHARVHTCTQTWQEDTHVRGTESACRQEGGEKDIAACVCAPDARRNAPHTQALCTTRR